MKPDNRKIIYRFLKICFSKIKNIPLNVQLLKYRPTLANHHTHVLWHDGVA